VRPGSGWSEPCCDWLIASEPCCDWLIASEPCCDWLIASEPCCDWLIAFEPCCDWLIGFELDAQSRGRHGLAKLADDSPNVSRDHITVVESFSKLIFYCTSFNKKKNYRAFSGRSKVKQTRKMGVDITEVR